MSLHIKKTLAAILVDQNKPLIIEEITLPDSLEIGQVLVEFHYSGICGSQLGEIDGVKGTDKWLPHLLGHEGSGTVISIGPGVKNVIPGQNIVAHWRPGKGIEAENAEYHLHGIKINAGPITTFNKFGIISENRVTPISEDYDLKIAALYGCAITTGFGTIENKSKIRLGSNVLIFGAGGIGLNLIQAAILAGACHVIAVDKFENRLLLAKNIGATEVIYYNKDTFFEEIKNILKDNLLDVFIDNTGNTEVINMGYRLIGKSGHVVLVGVPKIHSTININSLDLHFGKSITGTTGGESKPHIDINRYMNFLRKKNIDLSNIITDIDGLHNINFLIDKMRNGLSSGRCMIDFELIK